METGLVAEKLSNNSAFMREREAEIYPSQTNPDQGSAVIRYWGCERDSK